ncbi:MAG: menaquinone biosynthesis decarboxylase [Bacteroidales bacterium]|nr:menaquinone biosynthesis decarboxylase [Bacteroidales bacterium]
MAYKSLFDYIIALESAGELIRIHEFVSPELEITEIADRMVKQGGKALLFENTGTAFPLLINSFASDRRICMALGVTKLENVESEMSRLFQGMLSQKESFLEKLKLLPLLQEMASWMPKSISRKGSCQEVVMTIPDLTKLPVLKCWPSDGGPFITLPCVHTKDPVSGIRNLGMYRMQVFSPDLTGMHWHLHKGSAHHYQQYKTLGQKMPVSVTLGGDPVYSYVATAPLPENMDEYLLAGFLRKKKVQLVKCRTNDLEVPEDVDFVIEGFVDPTESLILEGPFGDHTGFYSLADYFPRFHVTCISHRKNAVYPATIVGIPPQEDGWIGKATEQIFRFPIKISVVPEIVGMHMPVEGVFHNITLVSIEKQYPGQGVKVMSSLWGAGQMMFNKIMAVFDAGVTLTDYHELARLISDRVNPLTDIHFHRGPVDILDHSSGQYAYGSKMGLDVTSKLPQEMDHPSSNTEAIVNEVDIRQAFPEVEVLRTDLPQKGISLVIVSLKKNVKQQIRHLSTVILRQGWIRNVKFLLFIDSSVDTSSFSQMVWISANNIDPMRDCFFVEAVSGEKIPVLCMDGTRKTHELDNFNREWPNIIVMDDVTIHKIDQRWDALGLGPFRSSPSLQFKGLVINDGAISQ